MNTFGVHTKRFRIFLGLAIFYMFPCTALCGFGTAFLMALGILLAAGVSWRNRKAGKVMMFVGTLFLFAGTALLFAWLSQYILGLDLFALGRRNIALEILIIFLIEVFFWIITNHGAISAQLTALLISGISVANYYVYTFRGSEMAPNDFMSVNTALTVAYDYEYTWTKEIVFAAGILLIFIALTTALPELSFRRKLWGRVMPMPLLAATIFVIITQSKGLNAEYFEQEGSVMNGYLVNFMLQIRSIFIDPPKYYSRQAVREVADDLYTEEQADPSEYPDVIVIMDESFADMSAIGDNLITSREVMPFIHSLTENTTKGYALSSVYGGGTPNSEYEVLTGNTMMFLPKGVMAYQQYIRQPTWSMVRVFHDWGYKTIAMHPFSSQGWMRTTVYPLLGFDEMYFEDDFPQKDMIRFFVSDQEMFETVLDKYRKNVRTEDNVFLFGVTMQNHGGYEFSAEDNPELDQRYVRSVRIDHNTDGRYDDAEQYLSLARETDRAVKYFLGELQKIDRDVVVLFYGDHFPGLSEAFYDKVLGRNFETLDEYQRKYTVPFFVWTNYDSEEKTVELTSLNYLSNYLYDAAGIEYPAYNRFLARVQEKIPALNANGYWSQDHGRFIRYREAKGDEYELLRIYNILEYNAVIDTEHVNRKLFP